MLLGGAPASFGRRSRGPTSRNRPKVTVIRATLKENIPKTPLVVFGLAVVCYLHPVDC
jgi:hypothetical protein